MFVLEKVVKETVETQHIFCIYLNSGWNIYTNVDYITGRIIITPTAGSF